MIVARWPVGRPLRAQAELVEEMRTWRSTSGREIGRTGYTNTTGSIGAADSLVSMDVRRRDLAERHQQWDALARRVDHARSAARVEPLLVSGSTRCEFFRTVD